ncbi:MAG: DNA-3-methyladenine glycosylase I [Candidatus Saccharimonadales bacterium]
MKLRCAWAEKGNKLYEQYHDNEWGVPVHNDRRLFEFITLEGAQAGLSWLTILKKREGYRLAFADFSPEIVAKFSDKQIDRLVLNNGIIRNHLKIKAAVTNARRFLEIQREFGSFDKYQWQFVAGKTIQNRWLSAMDIPSVSTVAEAFSLDLKKRGFKFVGPTIIYAHMQAVGMVNDHTINCFRYNEVKHEASRHYA